VSAAQPVAIIGAGGRFAQAPDIRTFWNNILNKVDAVREAGPDRWDQSLFYEPGAERPGKIYCKFGGYLPGRIPFRPAEHGIMPLALQGAEPDQFLLLLAAVEAFEHAGIDWRAVDGRRVGVIMGKGGYAGAGHVNYSQACFGVQHILEVMRRLLRGLPEETFAALEAELLSGLAPLTSETAVSNVPNLASARLANRMGFMGPNYTVDGACASSLLALGHAVEDLRQGRTDLALAGGSHLGNDVFFIKMFEMIGAVSRGMKTRPFDRRADGTLPGEGAAVVLLKRLEDAERAGDRVLAVVRGVGSASDGRGTGVLTPNIEGEVLAMQRAYQESGVDPRSVGLFEAHGTGTEVGDAVEAAAMRRIYGNRPPGTAPWCAVGAVKSMIGHCFPASGMAGLIKTALALSHKILPPTLHVEQPREELAAEDSPFYLNTESRPWPAPAAGAPRRAAVSAFGFGGVNAHVVLEEHRPSQRPRLRRVDHDPAPTELLVFAAPGRAGLRQQVERARARMEARPASALRDWAWTFFQECGPAGPARLAVVASSRGDFLAKASSWLERGGPGAWEDARGLFAADAPVEGSVAVVFGGIGSAYPGMFREVAMAWPDVLDDWTERVPEPDPLWGAYLRANAWSARLLEAFGIRPGWLTGHAGLGTLNALAGAGGESAFPEGALREMADAIERRLAQVPWRAADVQGPREVLEELLAGPGWGSEYHCVARHTPEMIVVGCAPEHQDALLALLQRARVRVQWKGLCHALHTPAAAADAPAAQGPFTRMNFQDAPRVVSPADGMPYPEEADACAARLLGDLQRPLDMVAVVEALAGCGVRTLVDAGAGGQLAPALEQNLRGHAGCAVALDRRGRHGVTQLQFALGRLFARGVDCRLDRFYQDRGLVRVEAEEGGRGPVVDIQLTQPVARISPAFEERVRAEIMAHLAPSSPQGPASGGRPLIGRVVEHVPGKRVRVARVFDPSGHDAWLLDHALGQNACRPGSGLNGMVLLPLAFSLEMMLEAVDVLCPGRVAGRVAKLSARQWAVVEGPFEAEVEVEHGEGDRLRARLRSADGVHTEADLFLRPAGTGWGRQRPRLEPPGQPLQRPRTGVREIYDSHALFHGPKMEAIREVEGIGEDALSAVLEVPGPGRLFGGGAAGGAFVLDPVLVDGFAQMLGFWFYERHGNLDAMPLRVEELRVHAPPPPPGTRVKVRLRVRHYQVTAWGDFEALLPDGSVWLEVVGWQSFRYRQPKSMSRFIQNPGETEVHPRWEGSLPEGVVAARRPAELEHMPVQTLPTTMYFLCSREEREEFRAGLRPGSGVDARGLARRMLDLWLLKDAARHLLRAEGRNGKWYPTEFAIEAEGTAGGFRCPVPGGGEIILRLGRAGTAVVALAGRERGAVGAAAQAVFSGGVPAHPREAAHA